MATYQNGGSATNGATNGLKSASSGSAAVPITTGERLASKAHPRPKPILTKSLKPTREGVANAFDKYAQVIQARVHPLPNQVGITTFGKTWGGLGADIKSLRAAGE